jgi:deoxyribose-phosphate aldolase
MKTIDEIIANPLKLTRELILELIQIIDLTSLDPCDSETTLLPLIDRANKGFAGEHVAAICVYSTYGNFVKQRANPSIEVAVVGGCFPTGQALSEAKIEECRLIAQTSIDEIDIVLNRGDYFDGRSNKIKNELRAIKNAIGPKKLKVILETGDYLTLKEIREVSALAIQSGADFIKTSTGKTGKGASPAAVYVMCQEILLHFKETGKKIGIKPSGGIRTAEEALLYYQIVKEVLGAEWLNKDFFRIGASSLYDALIDAYNN